MSLVSTGLGNMPVRSGQWVANRILPKKDGCIVADRCQWIINNPSDRLNLGWAGYAMGFRGTYLERTLQDAAAHIAKCIEAPYHYDLRTHIVTTFRPILANLQRRWQAEARLAEHELLCCGPQHGINCPRFEELALKLKELGE